MVRTQGADDSTVLFRSTVMQIEDVRVLEYAMSDFIRTFGEQQRRKAAAMNVVEGC